MAEIPLKKPRPATTRYETEESQAARKSVGQKINDTINKISDWSATGMSAENQQKRDKALGKKTSWGKD